MTLAKALDELKKHVRPNNGEYINILYGNAWEVQFFYSPEPTAETSCYVEVNKESLKPAIEKMLVKLEKLKEDNVIL